MIENHKLFDALSRSNRIYLDMLVRLINCEMKATQFDLTWYDVQLPFFIGKNKGEIQISKTSSMDFKTSKEVLSNKQIEAITELILVFRSKKESKSETRKYLLKYFNDSTLSCLN